MIRKDANFSWAIEDNIYQLSLPFAIDNGHSHSTIKDRQHNCRLHLHLLRNAMLKKVLPPSLKAALLVSIGNMDSMNYNDLNLTFSICLTFPRGYTVQLLNRPSGYATGHPVIQRVICWAFGKNNICTINTTAHVCA